MQSKPENWDRLWGRDGTICSYQILIGDEVYSGKEDIEEDSLKIYKPVFTADKPIGNTPCFSMECCLKKRETPIPRGAKLYLQVCLKNGDKVTDFIPMGTFKIYSRVNYPDGWVKLVCRDLMQTANQSYFAGLVEDDAWPKPMTEVMKTSLAQVGLTLDPRTAINTGEDWLVTPPAGLSIRTVWSYIAAAHGGNFIITPQETLLLVVPKATKEPSVETELSVNGFEVLGEPSYIDQVTLQLNAGYGVSSGDSGENNIKVDCPYGNQVIVDSVKEKLTGPLYYPVQTKDMVFDPAAEIQDTFEVRGLLTVWSDLTINCGIIPLCEGKAEAMCEPDNEYGFEDTPFNNLEAKINGANQYADDAAQSAVNGLTQEDIFNKLTNNGAAQGIYIQDGQLYINASYLGAGALTASLIKAGVLQSANGGFYLNLDTGEFSISGYASTEDLENLRVNGVEKVVTPLMKYALTDEGLKVKKPGEEIDNTVDNTGMYVLRGLEVMLRANKNGVLATDVYVRNFLGVGDYTRLENYNDGTDGRRTACFYSERKEE